VFSTGSIHYLLRLAKESTAGASTHSLRTTGQAEPRVRDHSSTIPHHYKLTREAGHPAGAAHVPNPTQQTLATLMFPKVFPIGMKTAPGVISGGRFY
jgi:hypothetical protein